MRKLTIKQTEYVAEFASGFTTYEIAETHSISHHTVRNTIRNARNKLECVNSANLVAVAVAEGCIIQNGAEFIPCHE